MFGHKKREKIYKEKVTMPEIVLKDKDGTKILHGGGLEMADFVRETIARDPDLIRVQVNTAGALPDFEKLLQAAPSGTDTEEREDAKETILAKIRDMLNKEPETLEVTDNSVVIKLYDPTKDKDLLSNLLERFLDRYNRCSDENLGNLPMAIVSTYQAIKEQEQSNTASKIEITPDEIKMLVSKEKHEQAIEGHEKRKPLGEHMLLGPHTEISGPTPMTDFEVPDGKWTEKHGKLNSLCLAVLNFLNENPGIASKAEITPNNIKIFGPQERKVRPELSPEKQKIREEQRKWTPQELAQHVMAGEEIYL